ncbi:MAG: PilZ domain-containing protein [Candidatus Omnitrophota bacterium]|nr:PilZ domain-containing protein [Candidatus Omnitrophota bacterium]
MQEKRKTARIEKALVIQYAQINQEPLRWDSTTIKNISIEGVLFNTNKIFTNNEKLQLRFSIPTDPFNRLEAVGEVLESSAHSTRVKFVNLGEQQRKTISDYVECLLKKSK